jgi:pilus assembly protein TadC
VARLGVGAAGVDTVDQARFQGLPTKFKASILRVIVIVGVMLALLSAEWWLLNHAQAVWPGLTGRIIVAVGGVGGLGMTLALTAWERRRRRADARPTMRGGQKRRIA